MIAGINSMSRSTDCQSAGPRVSSPGRGAKNSIRWVRSHRRTELRNATLGVSPVSPAPLASQSSAVVRGVGMGRRPTNDVPAWGERALPSIPSLATRLACLPCPPMRMATAVPWCAGGSIRSRTGRCSTGCLSQGDECQPGRTQGAGVAWPIIFFQHAANDTFVDLDAKSVSDLLGNAHAAEARIAPL